MTTNPRFTGVLAEALGKMEKANRNLITDHILGGTSANFLSEVIEEVSGMKVSATTIKTQRRKWAHNAN